LFFLLTFTSIGFGSEFWWYYALAAFIAIVFGLILTVCSRSHSNRLSFEKGLELAKRLEKVESKFLKGTDMGVRAGPEGAWIEVGFEKHLNTFYWKFIERKIDGEKIEVRKDELNLEKTTREVVTDIKGFISMNIASEVLTPHQTVALGQGSLADGPPASSQLHRYEQADSQSFAIRYRDRFSKTPLLPGADASDLQMPQSSQQMSQATGGLMGGMLSLQDGRDSFGQPSTPE